MDGRLQVFSGNGNRALALEIARELNVSLGKAIVGTFKNGEVRIRLEENVRGGDVFVIQSMCDPVDHHIMELCLMIDALRRSSAGRVTAVIPYYAYAKQEKKTSGREPISAKVVAKFVEGAGADRVLVVDLHAPAIEGFFEVPVDHLRAGPLLADYFRHIQLKDKVVVSPDSGGVGRATDFRNRLNAGLAIIAKQRPEDDVVTAFEMVGDVQGKTAIIVDDMISTGGTLVNAANLIMERGASEVYACAVHGLFAGDALDLIANSPLKRVVVTNTYPVSARALDLGVQVLSVAPLIAEAITRIHKDLSISVMFRDQPL
jgi:ribose-phosphate pyrophosphokinase